jgi:hypothetical protein
MREKYAAGVSVAKIATAYGGQLEHGVATVLTCRQKTVAMICENAGRGTHDEIGVASLLAGPCQAPQGIGYAARQPLLLAGPVSIGRPRQVRPAPFVDYCVNIPIHPIIASAFTVAELGAMLPKDLHSDLYFEADTEANARAKTLIYLLERTGRDHQSLPD